MAFISNKCDMYTADSDQSRVQQTESITQISSFLMFNDGCCIQIEFDILSYYGSICDIMLTGHLICSVWRSPAECRLWLLDRGQSKYPLLPQDNCLHTADGLI
jgi:hypothetical protein